MQALSISLSPAGRGDDKSVFSSAPAGDEESRVPFAEDRNFSDSFEAAALKKETGSESPPLETKEMAGDGETDTSPLAALAPVENQNISNTPPKGETLSSKSDVKSPSEIKPPSKEGNVPELSGKKNADDKAKAIHTAGNEEANVVQPKTAQGDIETQRDPDAPTEIKGNEDAASKATAELNINVKTGKSGSLEETGKDLPKSDKTLSVSESETATRVKPPRNLTEADSVENAIKKQVDQKAFGQADFFGATTDGSIKSSLLQTASSGADGSFALTQSLTAPTLSSGFSPNIQMIAANASAAVTNFNAVSQAMLVANETAKGVTVQLDPPEMGRVYIDFTFDADDQVNVVVKSEHASSHLVLRERSEQFLGFLKESGLENVNLTFEQGGQNGESGFNNQEASKPLYLATPSEDTLIFNSPTRTLSNDVQTYDGLDLRL